MTLRRTAFKQSPKPAKVRTRKCKVCRMTFVPMSMMHKCCAPACALAYVSADRAQLERKDIAKRKLAIKTRSEWIKEAQKSFNRYIRLRAIRFGHTCISSGLPLHLTGIGGGFDAGHFRSIGSAPHLRFNLNNVWGQSKKDNRYGAGASSEYRRGLIMRRGVNVVEALESNNDVRKFDISYLIRIKNIFDRKAKRIAKYV